MTNFIIGLLVGIISTMTVLVVITIIDAKNGRRVTNKDILERVDKILAIIEEDS